LHRRRSKFDPAGGVTNRVNDRRKRTVAILLLLLLAGFLIGVSVYQGRGATLPGDGGASRSGAAPGVPAPSYPGATTTRGLHAGLAVLEHVGAAPPSGGGGWDGAGRLHNLVLLRDWAGGNDPLRDGGANGFIPGADESGTGFGGPGFFGGGFPGPGGLMAFAGGPVSKPAPENDGLAPPDIAGAVSAVPEPQSWVLMILGFCAAGLGLRRRARPAKFLSP
jgi:hypothetical protein